MSNCKYSSIKKCLSCKESECKNLWGPVKVNSKCYNMVRDKLFDECLSLNGLVSCKKCEHLTECSLLIRQSVLFM